MNETLNTIRLLRFPFSVFLLPVSLFSLVFIQPEASADLLLVLGIWHLLVYPSSNAYNSYHDRDEGPIGGLMKPPKPGRHILYLTWIMDILAITAACLVKPVFAIIVSGYILASRMYSHRGVRLKRYPVTGFVVVFLFQGAWVFWGNVLALGTEAQMTSPGLIIPAAACSFFIATLYPLTQIYQHSADRKDGVTTISMRLGVKGTFVLSGLSFIVASILVFLSVSIKAFILFNALMLPCLMFFLYWARNAFSNPDQANYRNTMIMLGLSSILINTFFLILILN